MQQVLEPVDVEAACRSRCSSTPGSTSPARVPMTRPSSGVSPIEVSTGRPPRIAAAEAPLPRCSTIRRSSSAVRPRNAGRLARDVLVAGAVHAVATDAGSRRPRSRSRAYVAAAAGRPAKNAVSKTATCGTSGKASRAAGCPSSAGGLCRGASWTSSSMPATTSSSTSVGPGEPIAAVHDPVADREQVVLLTPASFSAEETCSKARRQPVSSTRSTVPLTTVRPLGSTTRYFSEDEPAFSTRTASVTPSR